MTNRRYIHFTALLSFCLDVASLTNLRPCVKMKLSRNIHWPVHQDDGKGNCVQQTKKQKGKVFSDICLQSLSVLHNVDMAVYCQLNEMFNSGRLVGKILP